MKISQEMYKKMCWCNNMQNKVSAIGKEVEDYLLEKGVDIDTIRNRDEGGYVDMVDYGRGCISKEDLEILFSNNMSATALKQEGER
jgi:hypothetical protein